MRAAESHMRSPQPAMVPEETIQSLYSCLLRFLPYACFEPGDCAVRTAGALASPLRGLPGRGYVPADRGRPISRPSGLRT